MSLFSRREYAGQTADQMIPSRAIGAKRGTVAVTNETALRHSAVWACLRLRANLVSSMPVDLFRRKAGTLFELPKPPVLTNPGGAKVSMREFLYSTQFDLDRAGNCFGLIREVDANGLPARIDLLSLGDVSVIVEGGEVTGYRLGGRNGEVYRPDVIWHEKQYTVAGLHVGLSPVAYAAWSIGEYLSIQDFALEWFGNMQVPAAHLKNTSVSIIDPKVAASAKERFKSSVSAGDPFVSGKDWEYTPLTMANSSMEWIDGKQYGVSDIARFFDVPGDLIDAVQQGSSLTYATITQRNLQFLIMSLQPAISRREDALTSLTPDPQFVKLNTNALLRMDPSATAAVIKTQIDSRTLAPSEARAIQDLPPFTQAQKDEFAELFGSGAAAMPEPPPSPDPLPIGTPND